MFPYLILTVILLGSTRAHAKLVDMSEDIGEEIFNKGKIYLLYVCRSPQVSVEMHLRKYCFNDALCSLIDEFVDDYYLIRDFVGLAAEEYLLIIDAKARRKYVLEITEQTNYKTIAEFHSNYKAGKLEPHYASEAIIEDSDEGKFKRLVGLSVDSFLNRRALLKIIYLYTNDERCSECAKIWNKIREIAQIMSNEQIVVFGYLDLFRNGHKDINAQNVPQLLVFTSENRHYEEMLISDVEKVEGMIERAVASKITNELKDMEKIEVLQQSESKGGKEYQLGLQSIL